MKTKTILAVAALGLGLCGESFALDLKDNTNTSGSSTLNAKDKKVFVPLKKTSKLGDNTGKIDSAVNGLRSNTPSQQTGNSQKAGSKKEAAPFGAAASQGDKSKVQPSPRAQKPPPEKYKNYQTDPEVFKKMLQDPEIQKEVKKELCPPGSGDCNVEFSNTPASEDHLLKNNPNPKGDGQ